MEDHPERQPNRRVEQGRQTRDRLIAAATRLFAENGYEGTSIEAVLQEADVSRGALYHHFANKEALFEAVLEGGEAPLAGGIVAGGGEKKGPGGALRGGRPRWGR